MSSTRLTLSIEDIDRQISLLRSQAQLKEYEAQDLQVEAAILKTKADKLEDLKKLAIEFGTPVQTGRTKLNRKAQIAKFLLENGPQTRKDIIERTGIPDGTINSEMRHRKIFVELPGKLWDVTDVIKQQHLKGPEEWDWEKLTEEDTQEQAGEQQSLEQDPQSPPDPDVPF